MNATRRNLFTPRNLFLAGCLIVALVAGLFGIRAAMAAGDTTLSFKQSVFEVYKAGGMRRVDVVFAVANPRADTGITAVVDMVGGATMQVDIPAGVSVFTRTLDMPSVGQASFTINSAQFTCAPTCSFAGTDAGNSSTVVTIGTPNHASTQDKADALVAFTSDTFGGLSGMALVRFRLSVPLARDVTVSVMSDVAGAKPSSIVVKAGQTDGAIILAVPVGHNVLLQTPAVASGAGDAPIVAVENPNSTKIVEGVICSAAYPPPPDKPCVDLRLQFLPVVRR